MNTHRISCIALGVALLAGVCHAQQAPRRPLSAHSQLKALAASAAEPARLTFAEVRREPSTPKVAPLPIPVPPEEQLTLNSEAVKLFSTKVQPILSNVCASCHARPNYEGAFKLKPISDGYANPQATEHNMNVAAKFVNREKPATSELLNKSVAAHGRSADPPLYSRQHPAYKHLELWAAWVGLPEGSPTPTISSVVASKGTPTATPIAPVVPPNTQPSKIQLTSATTPNPDDPPRVSGVPHITLGPSKSVPGVKTDFGTSAPVTQPATLQPEDPYDPAAFNRMAHPMRR